MHQPTPRRALRRLLRALAVTLLTVVPIAWPRASAAQSCATGSGNSCMTVSFTPVRPTPTGEDFAAGVGVIGSFTVSVLKCGRPPCLLLAAAANQPPGGLRLRVGGGVPRTLSECPVDLTGVTQPLWFFSPTLASTSGPATYVVWLCRPLSWDPGTTPLGTTSPEVRFRLLQN